MGNVGEKKDNDALSLGKGREGISLHSPPLGETTLGCGKLLSRVTKNVSVIFF